MEMKILLSPFVYFYALLFGGLISTLVYRLPKMLYKPTFYAKMQCMLECSYCPKCHTALKWHNKFPIVGFLLSKGRCVHCDVMISKWYLLAELVFPMITLALFLLYGLSLHFILLTIFVFLLIVLCVIDFCYCLLPNVLVAVLFLVGMYANALNLFVPCVEAIIGSVVGFLSFWLIRVLYRLVYHREGMGLGDVKLMAALGMWVGIYGLPIMLLVAPITLFLSGMAILYCRRKKKALSKLRMPFGPHLIVGSLFALAFESKIHLLLEVIS